MFRIKSILILLIMTIFLSCSKDEDAFAIDLIGDWDVVEYAKYKDGESVIFLEGKPYWHFKRYSQGISIEKEIYYYRYRLEYDEPNTTNYDQQGSVKMLNEKDLIFEIANERIEARIVQISPNSLWIKYNEGDYKLEFKYIRN